MEQILFSIIIPSYNKQNYISRAINSVLNQTYQNFEIIIIDDGSTDNSVSVIKQFKDKRIKLFVQKNLGVNNVRNKGIEKAIGNYIAFLDADDEFLPKYLQTVYDLIKKYPKNKFFGCAFKRVYQDNTSTLTNFGKQKDFIIKDFVSEIARNEKFFVHISSIVIKKEVFDVVGKFFSRSPKFNSGITILDDLDLWIRISWKYSLAFSNEIGCIYYTNTPINVIRGYGFKNLDCTFYEDTIKKLLKQANKTQSENLKKLLYKFRVLSATQFIIRNKFKQAEQIIKKCDNTRKEIINLKKMIMLKRAELSLIKKQKNIKILLVNPLWSFHNYPPLNLIELATYLIKNGFKHTKILDLNYKIKNKLTNKDFIADSIKRILSKEPDIVAITCNAVQFPFVCELSKSLKKQKTDLPVVIGGVMASLSPKDMLKQSDCDYVMRGEGEKTFIELIKAIQNNTDIKKVDGVSYKLKGKIVHNKDRALLDIKELPIPDYSLLSNSLQNNTLAWIVASRGCAYKCKFCSGNGIWKYQRRKDTETVYKQIYILKTKYNINNFVFGDDCLTLNKEWLLDLCNKIKPLKMTFGCLARVDTIDKDKLIALKEAGCKHIYHGIESGSPKVRESLDKHVKNNTNKFIADTIKMELDMGFQVTASFMSAIPVETKKDIEKTYKFAKQLKDMGCTIQLWILTPYQGLKIIKEFKKQLIRIDRTKTNLQLDIFDKGQFYLYRNFINKYNKYNADNYMFLPKDMTLEEFIPYFRKIQKKLGLLKENKQLTKKEIFVLENTKK